jgi:hypothetical protein
MRKTLRRSCAACAKAKHSCDLRTPKCSRCVKRNCNCVYANEPLTSTSARLGDISNGSQAPQASKSPTAPGLLSRSGGNVSADLSDMSIFFEAHLFDPFDSYPSTNLSRLRVQSLIQHCKWCSNRKSLRCLTNLPQSCQKSRFCTILWILIRLQTLHYLVVAIGSH